MASRTGKKLIFRTSKKNLSKYLELGGLSVQENASYCIKFTGLLFVNNCNI